MIGCGRVAGPGPAVDTNRTGVNTWITDQIDFTTPTVSHLDAESIVGIPDPASPLDPPDLHLRVEAAPAADYDAGDHANLSTDGAQTGVQQNSDLRRISAIAALIAVPSPLSASTARTSSTRPNSAGPSTTRQ